MVNTKHCLTTLQVECMTFQSWQRTLSEVVRVSSFMGYLLEVSGVHACVCVHTATGLHACMYVCMCVSEVSLCVYVVRISIHL